MQETLNDHHTSISIGRRPLCNLRFADVIDHMGGSIELQDLTNRLVDRVTAYGTEVSTEKSKITTNSTDDIDADIIMKGQKLEEMTSFKHLCKDGTCSTEIRNGIASAMATAWRSNTITFASEIKLYKPHVVPTFCRVSRASRPQSLRDDVILLLTTVSPYLLPTRYNVPARYKCARDLSVVGLRPTHIALSHL